MGVFLPVGATLVVALNAVAPKCVVKIRWLPQNAVAKICWLQELGQPQGLPLRVKLVSVPICRIVDDIIGDVLIRLFVSDNVFVIITLPYFAIEWLPIHVFYTIIFKL
jgi:hypothetical protein